MPVGDLALTRGLALGAVQRGRLAAEHMHGIEYAIRVHATTLVRQHEPESTWVLLSVRRWERLPSVGLPCSPVRVLVVNEHSYSRHSTPRKRINPAIPGVLLKGGEDHL